MIATDEHEINKRLSQVHREIGGLVDGGSMHSSAYHHHNDQDHQQEQQQQQYL